MTTTTTPERVYLEARAAELGLRLKVVDDLLAGDVVANVALFGDGWPDTFRSASVAVYREDAS